MNKVTIFYENSAGIMAQWQGVIRSFENKSIVIQFTKHKAFKYDLTQSSFLLVTKKKIHYLPELDSSVFISFNEKIRTNIKNICEKNIQFLWEDDAVTINDLKFDNDAES